MLNAVSGQKKQAKNKQINLYGYTIQSMDPGQGSDVQTLHSAILLINHYPLGKPITLFNE